MNIVVVELPAKAKTINKYLGSGYAGVGLVRPRARSSGQRRLGRSGGRFPDDLGGRPQGPEETYDIARALKDADKLILATDPDREGEAISWHARAQVLRQTKALKKYCRARSVQCHHQEGGAGGNEAPARHRCRPGQRYLAR